MKRFLTVGLGELLWDVFPHSRQLGGAPANFAYMTSLLGDEGIVASRVGEDDLGSEAKNRLKQIGLSTEFIQLDTGHCTGVVQVHVDDKGQPTFEIPEGVAWDFFEWIPAWQALAKKADAICFGSLAQRSQESREVIHKFLKHTRPATTRIFDVNLRQSYYSAQTLADSAKNADILKLNDDELPTVVQALGSSFQNEQSAAEWLLKIFGLKLVCVTRGARGSLLITEHSKSEHPGVSVKVGDTVGAGDAFTAAMVYHYLRRTPLAEMNEAANRMGSWVASQTGATPAKDEARIEMIRRADG